MSECIHYADEATHRNPGDGFAGSGWYFWDESQSDRHGPYLTLKEAAEALSKYAIWLTKGSTND